MSFTGIALDAGPIIDNINSFFNKRFKNGRAVALWREKKLSAILSFVILKDRKEAQLVHAKPHLADTLDNSKGEVCYIEKLLGDIWTRDMFKEAQTAILTGYPNIKFGVWFRPTKTVDRECLWYPHERRIILNASHRI